MTGIKALLRNIEKEVCKRSKKNIIRKNSRTHTRLSCGFALSSQQARSLEMCRIPVGFLDKLLLCKISDKQ
jgi:hypothetical protein